jgi:hypothetical protein
VVTADDDAVDIAEIMEAEIVQDAEGEPNH